MRNHSMSRWLAIPRPQVAASLRLFCFPYAGGGTAEFRAWAEYLPAGTELCAIQLPGREMRLGEAPCDQLERLVQSLATELDPYLDRPAVFYGHSFGAFVCYELARERRRRGCEGPIHLVVSGSRAPHVPNPEPAIYHLPDNELIAEIQQRYGGIPKEILENEEMLALVLPSLRADFTMADTYRYREEPPLSCPITCYGGDADPSTTPASLEAWREHTDSDFRLRVFAGGHFFIRSRQEAFLQDLTKILTREMRGAA